MKLMGIINVTPDSFYDGGSYHRSEHAIAHGLKLAHQGADILDIGGCSTRPFSEPPQANEEIDRVIPVIKSLKKQTPTALSLDSYVPEVVEAALECGIDFINDVTGFRDPMMIQLAAQSQKPICIMHMQNMPHEMQKDPTYPGGVVNEVIDWLLKQAELCIQGGVRRENIYLDPGIGFGKSLDDNFVILHNLDKFRALNFPLLIGHSRKSFLYKTLKIKPQECLAATIGVSSMIYPYVDMLRVHDVFEHWQLVQLIKKLDLAKSKELC